MEMIKIFDTTLRDGEQSPGASMNTEEKVKLALQLEKLGVDIIEAGFAAASPGDFEAISRISETLKESTICSLARAVPKDIELAAKALEKAKHKRIHTFIATSPIHMEYKLKMQPDEVIKRAIEAVKLARSLCEDIEFSCEDACRSDIGFLKEVALAVIEVGATTLNLPDTVGYRLPNEIGEMIREMKTCVGDRAILSVHCHNDLGLAVSNSIAGIQNGARQLECTINGLGERAGNTALEEVVMILKTRKDVFGNLDTRIKTKEIYATSKLVADITGIRPQPNKAIVGKNAFAHESGIHQDGMLKHPETYEIMKSSDIGIPQENGLVLGKHSGRAAFKDKLASLGFDEISQEELDNAFEKFKILCDKKKEIYDEDIRSILTDQTSKIPQIFELISLQISSDSNGVPYAAISIQKDGRSRIDAAIGNGSVDAILKTIDRVSGYNGVLKDYKVEAVSEGKDALAKVVVKVEFESNKPAFIGHGLHLDTLQATAKAYIGALNSYLSMQNLM
ncbi:MULTISPECIES: 2-isopropylmalate synthase [unclassified Helicobacter]|uniref:2-isopropylmalate synthase n=1 Tax=unclassified Helicobacter TaxID=2593540 RepID=UPI001F58D0C3|nr:MULTISPECIES: 2-isopropylmalate synthase [unclassified Helicobacter]MCI2235306.1 2-isopropylmalate synthase [Helicobacter sp. CaF467b]MCI7047262.1 2-isopropylmalate synthase [Helicobacter sp.]